MDRDSVFPELKVTRMGGIDQRTSPDDLDGEGHPSFSVLEGMYPAQDGLLSRVPGKVLRAMLPGEIILNFAQPFDSTNNILVQTNQNLYAFTLDELQGRIYTPTITPSSGSEDEAMSMAILSHKAANATSGGALDPNAVAASSTLTNSGATPGDTETVTINGKVYTFQTTLTNVDGHVFKGASGTAGMTNLFRAITLGTGSGTGYAAATTANTSVTATNPTATTVVVTALLAGTAGNAITTTDTMANASWTGATLSGGTGGVVDTFYARTLNTREVNQATIIIAFSGNAFTVAAGTYRIHADIIWNPLDAGNAIVGTTAGLWSNTGSVFEVYAGGSEPILSTAGKASTASVNEASNQILTLDAVFTAGGSTSYSIMQKTSNQAAVVGSNFCGIDDQCISNSNVNGAKSLNYYLMLKLWKQ